MSVFYVDATGFGIGEETFNPPSFPIKTERVFGRGDICGHYNQFVFDIFPSKRNKFSGVRVMPHNQPFHRPLRFL